MVRRNPNSGNQGIQANSVVADVLAVGPNASAQKRVEMIRRPEEYAKAIHELRAALDQLALPLPSKQSVGRQVDRLANVTADPNPNRSKIKAVLKSITDTIHSTGSAVKDLSDMLDPITKIATLAAIPLHLIGL